jgi:hypothetical protein
MSRRHSRVVALVVAVVSVVLLSEYTRAGLGTAVTTEGIAGETAAVQPHGDVYVVNGRIRPLLLFWIGRDNIGEARLTRTRDAAGHDTIELLIGSDPARAPRKINRWGYVREQVTSDGAALLGLMRASDEQTLEEAEAAVAREGEGTTLYKAIRTMVRGSQAVSDTMRVQTPATYTFRDLGAILESLPERATARTTTQLPAGTMPGFLFAMDALLRESADVCARPPASGRPRLRPRPYFYNHTLYDLTLVSCELDDELRTKVGVYPNVVDGRFEIRNRSTREVTRFQITFGSAGALAARPVRAVFRPHWWIELELLLDQSAGTPRA